MTGDRAEPIRWRLHLNSAPAAVFDMLATRDGRERFWAEAAPVDDGHIDFGFPDGTQHRARLVAVEPPTRFALQYFGASATFDIEPDGDGGTDLTLTRRGLPTAERAETAAGWVSVLLALKAAVDHGIDLRNHDPDRTWAQGYVDN